MLSPKVEEQLDKISWFCKQGDVDCKVIVGYLAVYRVEFGTVMFFLLLAIIMLGVKSSNDPRSGIQNGFWAIKFLLLIGAIVGAFFIPNTNGTFVKVWMYIGLIGAFFFILIQLILLVDFAHSWNETWVDNMEETGSKVWMVALLLFTFIMYALSFAGIVCMFIYFTNSTEEGCHLEKFIVSFQLIMSALMSLVAITPAVQEGQPKSGLLQAAAISLYTSYLTWSALSYKSNSCNSFRTKFESGDVNPDVDAQSVIGVVITFVLVLFACVRTSSSSQIGKLGLSDGEKTTLDQPDDQVSGSVSPTSDVERKGQQVHDDEGEAVSYSYTFFHITMMFASLYLMMTITNWYKPSGSNLNTLSASIAAFWVKIASSWMCMGLYLWTLLAPVCLPDRDFS